MGEFVGRVCHGKPRGPREPYGTVAPLLRAVAWGMVFLGTVATAAGVAVEASAHGSVVARVTGAAGGTLLTLGVAARVVATSARPMPLTLPGGSEPPS